jgi:hypothetical protein
MKIERLKEGNNILKHVKHTFRPVSPPFRGLGTDNVKATGRNKVVDMLADHYEKHFEKPQHDKENWTHQEAIPFYTGLGYLPGIPLEQIKLQEVIRE